MCRLLINRLLALLSGAVLHAQPLDWPSLPCDYVAQDESLRDVLANFGASYGASVIVSNKASDQISGRFNPGSPQAFLQLMVSLYNLGWCYDGTVLHVFRTTEMQSRLVKPEQVDETELKRALTAAGIWEPRFGWRADPSGQLVYVSDPGRYPELVEQAIQVLKQQYTLRSEKTSDLSVEVFPLRYVATEDRKIRHRDNEIKASGIANILSQVPSDTDVVAMGDEPNELRPGPQSSHTVVQAEPSLNAVVVHDHKDRLPVYRRLVEALDRPSARIEAGLPVTDISAGNPAQLGVDWSAGIRLDNNKSIQARAIGQDNEKGDDASNGVVSSLVDSRRLNFLLAKVTLLQSRGQTQIGFRPTLLTQENTQAVLDQNETYYVWITGERVVELKAIAYGAMLKMTPRVVTLGDTPEINLNLHIEDGSQKSNNAGLDKIPTINRTVIDTITRVGHGRSLLTGGIYRDELSQSQRKVPWLGNVPYLGALFRTTADTVCRSVRLLLIEPRLIDGGVGHYLVLNNRCGLRGDLFEINELSNQNLSLRKLLGSARCQALASTRAEQERLRQADQDSLLALCRMGAQED